MVEENRSPDWGYVYTNVGLDSSFVQTEGGFTYPVLPFFSMSPNFLYMSEGAGLPTMSPSDLLTPTALDPVSRALTATTRAVEITPTVTPTPRDQLSFALTATVQYLLDLGKAQNIPSTPIPLPTNGASQLFYRNAHQVYIPPSFAIRGFGITQFDVEAPLGWFQAAYQVAETQNHFKLTIPSITINCIYGDGSTGMETSKPIVLDLDKDIRTIDLPVTENSLNIRNLTDWIDLAENGKIQFTSVSLAQTPFGLNMVIPYQFVNTNAGYQSTVPLSVYIIGSDGLIRENICDRKTTAGPSQSTSGKVCFSLSSRLAESLKSVYLVWSWQNERIVLGSPVNFR